MRKLAIFAAAFSVAVFLAVYLLPEAALLPVGVACALGALVGLLLKGNRRLGWMLVCVGLCLGAVWTSGYTALFHAPAQALAGQEADVSATVSDWPVTADYGDWVLVRVDCPDGPDQNARLYLYGDRLPDLRPGDRVSVTARFRLADTLSGEPTDYYHAKGVTLIGYVKDIPAVERPEHIPPRH